MTSTPYVPYAAEQPWLPFSEVLFDWDEDFHNLMLNDRLRMVAYEKAIKASVKPGDIVLDLGVGTGVLSIWALEAGASHVYGIDLNAQVLGVAVKRIAEKGFSDRFTAINKISYEIDLPKKVDVLISEIIGNVADNEDFQPILKDAITRFLKPDGIRIPSDTRSYIVPVAAEKAKLSISSGNVATLNSSYSLKKLMADKNLKNPFNLYFDTIIPAQCHLSESTLLRHYYDDWSQTSQYTEERKFRVQKEGILTGFKAYFKANLIEGVELDVSGDSIAQRTCSDSWKHAFFPIQTSIPVRRGDTIKLKFSRYYPTSEGSEYFRQIYRWRGWVEMERNLVLKFDQCMDEGVYKHKPSVSKSSKMTEKLLNGIVVT